MVLRVLVMGLTAHDGVHKFSFDFPGRDATQ
jgi:hypothetical protein